MKLGNEECDDGNLLDNDGCSSTCTVEQGFTCTEQTQSDTRPCTAGAGECLTLPIVLRDFKGQNEVGGHPDFFYMGAPGIDGETTYCVPNAACDPAEDLVCPDLAADITPRCAGLVMPNLNDQGKPAFNATNRLCDCVFTDWDGTGIINAVPGAAGTGPDGHDQVQATIPMVQSAETFAQWYTDVAGVNTVQRTVLELNYVVAEQVFRFSSSGGRTVLDDIHDEVTLASGFFPLENAVTDAGKLCNLWTYWVDWPSCAGNQYDMIADDGTWVASQGMLRNFYFTTEARYLMVYQGGESLRFFGDDDVWVFINGVLAVDLGGTHQQLAGSVTLATGGDARFGLEVGNTYEIVVFHADRHPRDSNYELTLSGFQTEISTCEPFCGDGIRTMMEECDAGMQNNDTDYGGCKVDCTYGPFCGDGILNGPELCDDGTNDTLTYNGDGCAPGCVPPPRCGDGVINDQREQCDDGENNNDAVPGGCSTECRINPKCGDGVVMYDSGEECDYGEDNAPPDQVEYGGCTTDCKLGPYCGDGVQTTPPELCDDGNAESGDGCSAACISEIVI
jgi:fibro-slime domain-containing protein